MIKRSLLAFGALFVALFVSADADAATRIVRLDSTPPGATVYLDDTKSTPLGVTPVRRARVPYGFHEFIFVLEGYETQKIPVNVGRRTKKVKAELPQLAKVMVSAGSASARSAEILIDGKPMGKVPWSGFIPAGRHRIEILKKGYAPFGDWVELAAGQILTLPAVLAEATKKGTLFITADMPVAAVFIDGRPVGEVPVLIDVRAGKAVVEVHGGDGLVWRKTVTVKAGDKTIVEAALLPETGPAGTALILSNIEDTEVWVDGKKSGIAPVTLKRLAVGAHIVEGKSEGYASAQTTVRVNANEQSVVKLELKPAVAEFGRISVRASVPGAKVFVDGGERGPAPVEMDQVPLGPHAIVVRADGHADFKASCEVKRNQTCSVMAAQIALARIRVISAAPEARLFIDGKGLGPLPYEGSLSADSHVIKVEAPHHISKELSLVFEASTQPRELNFDLTSDGTSATEIAERKEDANQSRLAKYAGASHLSGVPPAPGTNRLHLSLGMPYNIEGGGTVGLVEHVAATVRFRLLQRDAGIGTGDLILGAHVGFRPIKPVSFGAHAEVWGGSNMERVGIATSVGASLRGIATLHFGEKAQFSLTATGELSRDSWDATEDDYIGRCAPARDGKTSQATARILGGLRVLVWVKEKVGIWGDLDVNAVGPPRCMYEQSYFGAFDFDPEVYLRAGATVAF